MYLAFAVIAGLIGGAFSVYMRMELMDPGVQYMVNEDGSPDGHQWNMFVTAHGLIMVFFVVMPAVIGGFGGCVSLLAAAGADLNVLDESNGNTVLMELARKGQTRMCRRLLEAGADHTVKDEAGRTALDLAREKGWDTTAAVLEAWANGTRDPALLHRTALGLPSDATVAEVLEAEAEYGEPRLLGDAPCLIM